MNKLSLVLFVVAAIISTTSWSQVSDRRAALTDLIVRAFNEKPDSLVTPLTSQNVHLGQQDGRVDVNEKAKFSYYVSFENSADSKSRLILIPMATSRFTPTYYQTDEWWDAHKAEIEQAKREGRPMPRQDSAEVEKWLKEMKLSTNPDVLIIDPSTGQTQRTPLQTFLLQHYLKYYDQDGYITLYRGAEKPGEIDSWNRREMPRGVRYWTPTANYAWRYARKNIAFLDELLADRTPLFKFRVPTRDFVQMMQARWPRLTLGTELTKNAHQSFDRVGQFQDHLYQGQPFLGEGHYGVEFEVRSSRAGALNMTSYYAGPATVTDLVFDRKQILELTRDRLIRKNPELRDSLTASFGQRIERVQAEGKILLALKEGYSQAVVSALIQQLPRVTSEIGRIDGVQFESWAQSKSSGRPGLKTESLEEQMRLLERRFNDANPYAKMCRSVFI